MRWNGRRAIALACAAVFTAETTGVASAQTVMKIATVNAGDNPRNVAPNERGSQLGLKTGGGIKGEDYLKNHLAKGEAGRLEATQLGQMDIPPVGAGTLDRS